MSFIQPVAATAPLRGSWNLRLADRARSIATAFSARFVAGRRLCEGCLIGLAGAIVLALIAGSAGLMVHQIDEASRTSNEERVEQLLRAVTYQLDTMMVGIRQTMRHSDEEIREFDSPQKLVELAANGRVSTHLLKHFLFIDPQGQIVASGMGAGEKDLDLDVSGVDYLRSQLGSSAPQTRIRRPLRIGWPSTEVIPVTHTVRHANGQVMGVLVAMIDVPALERIWSDIGFRTDDRIELIGEDNTVWFSWSQATGTQHAAQGSKSWSRPIAGWPMEVVATLDPATVDRHSIGAKRLVVGRAALEHIPVCRTRKGIPFGLEV